MDRDDVALPEQGVQCGELDARRDGVGVDMARVPEDACPEGLEETGGRGTDLATSTIPTVFPAISLPTSPADVDP